MFLSSVSQDLIIRENNCRTKEGIEINRIEGQKYGHNFGNRLFSRVPLEDIKEGNHVLAKALEVIDRPTADLIDKSKINIAKVVSACNCEIKVVSDVTWTEKGINRAISVESHLFDWQ